MRHTKRKTYVLVSSKSVFKVSLWVGLITILGVYFWGLGAHHTFFENSILSTTILSIAFFTFITTGLFRGIKLKDDLGKVMDKYNPAEIGIEDSFGSIEPIDAGDGIAGIFFSILLWILMAIVLAVALWIFSAIVAAIFFVFIAMLYWIFFRAMRLVFKNSNRAKGNIFESIKSGIMYTVLYNFWIYGIIVLTHYLKR